MISRPPTSQLREQRIAIGGTPGSLESWLLLRSLRTLSLRARAQSATATSLVARLESWRKSKSGAAVVEQVLHPSIQQAKEPWLMEQMPGGLPPVFSLVMHNEELAKTLPSRLALFADATSLGGVESLADYRRRWDGNADPRLVRFSVGVEGEDDLATDLSNALGAGAI